MTPPAGGAMLQVCVPVDQIGVHDGADGLIGAEGSDEGRQAFAVPVYGLVAATGEADAEEGLQGHLEGGLFGTEQGCQARLEDRGW